jgi:hypothetical protein
MIEDALTQQLFGSRYIILLDISRNIFDEISTSVFICVEIQSGVQQLRQSNVSCSFCCGDDESSFYPLRMWQKRPQSSVAAPPARLLCSGDILCFLHTRFDSSFLFFVPSQQRQCIAAPLFLTHGNQFDKEQSEQTDGNNGGRGVHGGDRAHTARPPGSHLQQELRAHNAPSGVRPQTSVVLFMFSPLTTFLLMQRQSTCRYSSKKKKFPPDNMRGARFANLALTKTINRVGGMTLELTTRGRKLEAQMVRSGSRRSTATLRMQGSRLLSTF